MNPTHRQKLHLSDTVQNVNKLWWSFDQKTIVCTPWHPTLIDRHFLIVNSSGISHKILYLHIDSMDTPLPHSVRCSTVHVLAVQFQTEDMTASRPSDKK